MKDENKLSLREYKSQLIETEQRLSEQFDKIMLTVSGGALALSVTFVKDIIGDDKMLWGGLLLTSWGFLISCIIFNFFAFHFGIKAYRKAQNQVENDTIDDETPGGVFSTLLNAANCIRIILLCIGLITLFTFSYLNLAKEKPNGKATNTSTEAAAETSTTKHKKGSSTNQGLPCSATSEVMDSNNHIKSPLKSAAGTSKLRGDSFWCFAQI